MKHQSKALKLMEGREHYGLFMEQGTGKTWTLLADAERLYRKGLIDAILVIAPNGVHVNWVKREVPAHMEADTLCRAWRSGAGKKLTAHIEDIFAVRKGTQPLRVFAINVDAMITKKGVDIVERFLASFRTMIVVDESSRIKNPDAGRTKAILRLRSQANYARIATGTPVTNAPADVFSQMQFLKRGLLGTNSYRAFVAEYAELLEPDHPMMEAMIQNNPRAIHAQIVARDPQGNPIWRNLDKLQKLLEPHAFRVLKKDCLDLPDKIYKTQYFQLDKAQQKAYKLMHDELRYEVDDDIQTVKALSAGMKLQQITSGFIMGPEGELVFVGDKNPRRKALMDLLEDLDGQMIVWARFRAELDMIQAALAAANITCVAYHGGIGRKQRETAVDSFQDGSARVFLGQPQAGGIGLTLTAAETVIYYSNDFNLETRLQSEDRAHRIGTKKNVVYIDLAAEDTIDETITSALQRKTNMAAAITGDIRR